MTDPTSPISPTSSAARLAAQANTTELMQDRRLTTMSPVEYRAQEVTQALYAVGLNERADASAVRRVVQGCAAGADLAEFVAAVAEAMPGWFVPTERTTSTRSADRLAKSFNSGQTAPRRGGVH
jgi:hypothetical protein